MDDPLGDRANATTRTGNWNTGNRNWLRRAILSSFEMCRYRIASGLSGPKIRQGAASLRRCVSCSLQIAEFIHEPKRVQGQRRSYPRDPVKAFTRYGQEPLVEDVKRVRALWKQYYGLWKRSQGQVSAEEIVAVRHDCSPEKVEQALKTASH